MSTIEIFVISRVRLAILGGRNIDLHDVQYVVPVGFVEARAKFILHKLYQRERTVRT